MSKWRPTAFIVATVACVFASSCIKNFGTGGTGEIVVPKHELREIQSTDLADASTTAPTTLPTTGPATLPATQPAVEIPLSLERVRQLALQNNLDLKVVLLDPTISKQAISEEEAQFETLFTTDAQYAKIDQPTASELNPSEATESRIAPGLSIPLITGGTIDLSLPIERLSTNNQFATLNPSYTSDAAIALTQPLLRGFGPDVNAQRIRLAFYQYQESQALTKLQVIRVLADADRIYWRLYAARQELAVRKREYDLAVAQLDRAKRQAAVGAVAQVEVVRAESGVADRVDSIIIADTNARDRERDLKRILNSPEMPIGSATTIAPATDPRPLNYTLSPERLVEQSMHGRMELLDSELRIAEQSSNVRFARNEMLPLVTLQYTYNINGLGPSLDDSFTLLREKRFEDHTVGVRLEVPIGNEAARSRLRRALSSRLQELATREQRELQIRQEVYAAVDQLTSNWNRIIAGRARVVAAARVLDVEIRQFNQGLRTSTDVLDAQTRLADAKLSEVSAVADYEISQVDIAFATGTLLGRSKVIWDPTPVPKR